MKVRITLEIDCPSNHKDAAHNYAASLLHRLIKQDDANCVQAEVTTLHGTGNLEYRYDTPVTVEGG